jgi:LuxR family maltose regulon positive regulatory protein
MPTPILRTKLFFPSPRLGLVYRPRLVQRLEQGLQGPLTLISAPAGSGKTTLLSEWRAASGARMPVAWLSLDTNDNDPSRFFTYVAATLETMQPGLVSGVGALLQAGELPAIEVVTTSLIIDLQDFPQNFALVLDDYHDIDEPTIHKAISLLLENMPPQMHLVLLTRADPPLPLARMRAGGQLMEIRLENLRFTVDEATAFLNDVMGLDLTPQQVAALDMRAEGWIAGLQLAALSMQGQDSVGRAEFIRAFAGSHHYILDYLSEEALHHQPPEVQRFLLRTSILERLCGSLCDALTGREDGSASLAKLEKGNLFLIPLDDERCWYRYHHLFADMLANRLRLSAPEELPALHMAASHWYEEAGLSDEAIRHALSARDYDRAAHLLREGHLQVMYTRRLSTLGSWLADFPESFIRSDPWLGIVRMHQMWSTGQREGLGERALEAQAALRDQCASGAMSEVDHDFVWLWGETLSFLALSKLQVDPAAAVELAKQAVSILPPQAFPLGFALGALYMAYRFAGQIDQTVETCRKAIEVTRSLRYPSMLATATSSLGQTLIIKGRLREAERIHRETLQFAEDHGLAGIFYFGVVHTTLAEILREWNQLDQADYHLNTGLTMIRQGGLNILLITGLLNQAWLKHSQRDLTGALASIDALRHECRNMDPDTFQTACREVRIRCLIDMGELDEAASWVESVNLNPDSITTFEHARELMLAGRCLAILGEYHTAVRILEQLESYARGGGHIGLLIQILVTFTIIFEKEKDQTGALMYLLEALELAEPEGYMRVFLNEGVRMRDMFNQLRLQGKAPDYIARLLAAFGRQEADVSPSARPSALLSNRELELLGLIAAGRTNREIAGELFIAIGTVKRHTVNIFTKLNAANRTDAVAKARQMGFIH